MLKRELLFEVPRGSSAMEGQLLHREIWRSTHGCTLWGSTSHVSFLQVHVPSSNGYRHLGQVWTTSSVENIISRGKDVQGVETSSVTFFQS